jgi:hypothetical protein
MHGENDSPINRRSKTRPTGQNVDGQNVELEKRSIDKTSNGK